MIPHRKHLALTLALFFAAIHAGAQGWSTGDSPVISNGTSITVSSAQPNLMRIIDNGTLSFVSGGSVTLIGTNAIPEANHTLVGSNAGESGVFSVAGGSVIKQGGGVFAAGYSGGSGILTVSSGTLSLTNDLFIGSGAGSVGTAALSGGTLVTRRVWVGNDGATGSMSVASGATWTSGTGDLFIGAYGATGALTFASGASFTRTNASIRVGYQAGNGTLILASGSVVDLTTNALYVSGNADNQRTNATIGSVWIAGTLKADTVWLTPWFPTGSIAIVDSGLVVLQTNGVLQTGYFSKNDRAASTLRFEGGTLRATRDSASLIAIGNNGIVRMIIADGQSAIFDTNGKSVTLAAPSAGNQLTLVGDTASGAVGNGGLIKTGAGSLIVRLAAADNTFTGIIEVVQGTLDLGRALATNQTVIVHSGATFVMYSSADASKVTVQGAPATRMLYAVGADTDSLNLSALSGSFCDDRLGTALSGTATLSGTLTHTNSVGIIGSPFRLIGQGGTLNLTNTTLEAKATQIEGTGTFNFLGSRTLTAADAGKILITDGGFRQDQNLTLADANAATPTAFTLATGRFAVGAVLSVGTNGYGTFTANGPDIACGNMRIGGGTGYTGAFTQSTGTVTCSGDSYVGLDGGTGRLTVAGGQFIVNADLRMASNPGDTTSRTLRPGGSITVSNALLRCNAFYYSSWWPTDGSCSNLQVGTLSLQNGAQAEVNQVIKNDDPIGTLLFDGGLLRARIAQSGGLLNVSQANGTLRVISSSNQYATFDVGANEVTLQGGAGRLVLTGAGGFKKLGSGRLTFSASDASYTGDTVIAAGTLRLASGNQIPDGLGKGNVQIATNGILELNGQSETVNRLIGLGSVINTNAPATLAVLADGSSDTWQRNWLQGNIQLDKQGTGTLSLAAANVIASNATVSAGTLRLTSSDGYPYYRFKVEGVKTPSVANSMQLSEIALFNNGVNVTSNRIGILYDPTGGIGGTATVNAFPSGELPEMAVDGIKPADGSATNNKWLDFRAATNRTAADRDRVWLRIDFPSAQKLTTYNWATGNDSPDRDPSLFRLQGSYNGTDWSDIDVQSNYNATATRNAWVSGSGFAVSSMNVPNAINDRANVAVNAGARLLLDGVSETFGGLTGYGTVALSNANLTLTGSTNSTVFFGGTLTGSGSLIKTGAGTQSICGTNAFTGDVVVQSGTLAVQGGTPSTWFRFTIKRNKNDINVTQLSEFALYSADGVRRNLGLAQGTSTNALFQGQFATPVAYSTGSGTSSEGPGQLFDNSTATKWCANNNTPNPTNESTYRVVVMRLTNSTPEITSYNICTANDVPDRDPITWTLESSPDGVNWITVDTRADIASPSGYLVWYNNGAAYTLAGRAVVDGDTDSIPNSSVVEIRSGATLSVTNGLDVIGALRVDMTSAGTLTKLTAQTNGTLYLVNVSGLPKTWTIPLAITTVTNPSALKSWTIYANGVQLQGYKLAYNAATGKFILNAQGTLFRVL